MSKNSLGQIVYTPLVKQILEKILDPSRPDIPDVEFRSQGFKDFLKTGFGYVLLYMIYTFVY